jgi:hypothetical protein
MLLIPSIVTFVWVCALVLSVGQPWINRADR